MIIPVSRPASRRERSKSRRSPGPFGVLGDRLGRPIGDLLPAMRADGPTVHGAGVRRVHPDRILAQDAAVGADQTELAWLCFAFGCHGLRDPVHRIAVAGPPKKGSPPVMVRPRGSSAAMPEAVANVEDREPESSCTGRRSRRRRFRYRQWPKRLTHSDVGRRRMSRGPTRSSSSCSSMSAWPCR